MTKFNDHGFIFLNNDMQTCSLIAQSIAFAFLQIQSYYTKRRSRCHFSILPDIFMLYDYLHCMSFRLWENIISLIAVIPFNGTLICFLEQSGTNSNKTRCVNAMHQTPLHLDTRNPDVCPHPILSRGMHKEVWICTRYPWRLSSVGWKSSRPDKEKQFISDNHKP